MSLVSDHMILLPITCKQARSSAVPGHDKLLMCSYSLWQAESAS